MQKSPPILKSPRPQTDQLSDRHFDRRPLPIVTSQTSGRQSRRGDESGQSDGEWGRGSQRHLCQCLSGQGGQVLAELSVFRFVR